MINDTTRYNSYINTGDSINNKQQKVNNMIIVLKLKELVIDKEYNRIHTIASIKRIKELQLECE